MCCTHLNRRDFLGVTTGLIAGTAFLAPRIVAAQSATSGLQEPWDPDRAFLAFGKPLRVQPILMYATPQRREQSSWKSWGGIQTTEAAAAEADRIAVELQALAASSHFGLEILPVAKVASAEEAAAVHRADYDVVVVYPATGSGNTLRACFPREKDALVFVRHRSGPVYYWYEALSVSYLNTTEKEAAPNAPFRASVNDVVVDDIEALRWRLGALYTVKNFLGTRIVALGGAWGKYAERAPEDARKRHLIEIVDVPYDAFEPRIRSALADNALMRAAEVWTDRYLAMPNTMLLTDRKFVVNAFILYALFKDLLRENDATAFTIKSCMGTIIPMAETTACLTLGLLNDEGLLAFCESDFVIIPAGILLRYLAGTPVFLHNSTFPHQGVVTCAHCSAPRRMDAKRYEPVDIMTHYESEYGAAPKVAMPVGQEVTFIDPEYSTGRWLGFTGVVEANPLLEICRSQQDVRIQGDWKRLLNEVRDSHWVMVYGNHLEQAAYAARKIGIRFETIA